MLLLAWEISQIFQLVFVPSSFFSVSKSIYNRLFLTPYRLYVHMYTYRSKAQYFPHSFHTTDKYKGTENHRIPTGAQVSDNVTPHQMCDTLGLPC